MESYHQQQQEYLGSSYFQPIHSDLSYESYEEESTFAQECFNKSIFRQPDDAGGNGSPPTVSRANPVGMGEDEDEEFCYLDDEIYNVITPYPYSPCQEELEDRHHFVSEIPQLATLSSDDEAGGAIDYSFYFETKVETQPGQLWEDGIVHSYSTQTEACAAELRSVSSPAQISDTDSMGEGN